MTSYAVEEVFQDDPNNPDNVLLTIPNDILNKLGWVENTELEYEIENSNYRLWNRKHQKFDKFF